MFLLDPDSKRYTYEELCEAMRFGDEVALDFVRNSDRDPLGIKGRVVSVSSPYDLKVGRIDGPVREYPLPDWVPGQEEDKPMPCFAVRLRSSSQPFKSAVGIICLEQWSGTFELQTDPAESGNKQIVPAPVIYP